MFISPFQALYMALSILVIQQLDGNLIKPLLFGKSMNIHPLTIILVLIGAGSVAGILGMLICIPVYAVIKTIILNIRKIYLLRRMEHVSEKLLLPRRTPGFSLLNSPCFKGRIISSSASSKSRRVKNRFCFNWFMTTFRILFL